MINFDAIFAEVYATRQLNELERKRWAGLTAEQRTEELRVREVKALERLAGELLIRDTGRRESAGRGRPLIVWTVTDAGWNTFTGGQREAFTEMRVAALPKLEQPSLL